MLPTLLSLGPIRLGSFGVMMMLAFVLGAFVVWRQGREAHFDEDKLFDAILVSVFWGILGGRVFYVLERGGEFGVDVWAWLSLVGKPGLSAFGGMVVGALGLWWFAKRMEWDFWEIGDVMMPGWVLAMLIGWLGAFLNGSGYGTQSSLPWAVRFVGVEGTRHPIQVYSALLLAGLFWLVLKLEREYRTYDWYQGKRGEALPGFVFWSGLIGLGLVGWLMSWFKPAEVYWWIWSVEGWQWLTGMVLGMVGLYIRSRRRLGDELKLIRFKAKRGKEYQRRLSKRSGGVKRGSYIN